LHCAAVVSQSNKQIPFDAIIIPNHVHTTINQNQPVSSCHVQESKSKEDEEAFTVSFRSAALRKQQIKFQVKMKSK